MKKFIEEAMMLWSYLCGATVLSIILTGGSIKVSTGLVTVILNLFN